MTVFPRAVYQYVSLSISRGKYTWDLPKMRPFCRICWRFCQISWRKRRRVDEEERKTNGKRAIHYRRQLMRQRWSAESAWQRGILFGRQII